MMYGQCDQIRRFLKVLDDLNVLLKVGHIFGDYFGFFENITL